ncbi:MAG: hypothetical protein ABIR32_10315 [Ilumatobacteraceae bacterium]
MTSGAVQPVAGQDSGGAAQVAGLSAGAAAGPAPQSSLGDAQLTAILNAVEQQLTRYFGAMSARADAVQEAGEAGRSALAVGFQQQIDALKSEHDRAQVANEGYEQALQAAIEDRLTEFAASQHWRVGEVEARLERISEEITLGLPTQLETATAPLQQRLDRTTELLANRIEELQVAARRFDEQSSALVNHVNETSTTLSRRLDETGRAFAGHLDERTMSLSQRTDDAMNGMRQHVSEQVSTFGRKIEDTENKVIDRALAMEERINEQTGVRLAGVEATIGRISSGIDDAIIALSHRVIELENSNNAVAARVEEIATQIESVDQDAINNLREQMSSAVGESMLVRIELERVASSTGEQFDKFNVRLAELASDIAESTLDVSTAVQLERLEEIERSLVELDPAQFVRKCDLAGAAAATNGPATADLAPPSTDGDPSESNLSSW